MPSFMDTIMKKIIFMLAIAAVEASLCAASNKSQGKLDATLKKIWTTVTAQEKKQEPEKKNEDAGPLAGLSKMYREGQAKFNEKQKEAKKEEVNVQETSPSIVVFGSKENATFIDEKLNTYEMSLQKLSKSFHDLHKDLSKQVPSLVVDEDFEAEMTKSQVIVDTLKRMCTYIQIVDQSIKMIHAGVAILISINSIENESYAIGGDDLVKGLSIISAEKTILNTIKHEINLLLPLIQPRHQSKFLDMFNKYVPDITNLKSSFEDIAEVYEKEICSKIARKDLVPLFNNRCENMKNFAESVDLFIDFVEKLQKYYSVENSPLEFKVK